MPSCFLILQRLFVRVDEVVVRVFDTRIFHKYAALAHSCAGRRGRRSLHLSFFFLIFFFLFFFIAFLSSRLGTNYVLRNFLQLEAPTVEVEERMMVKSTDRRAVHALYDSAKVRPGTNRKARARQGWPFSHT